MEVTSFGRGGGCSFFIKVLVVGVYWKIWFLGGAGFLKNQYIGRNCLKRRGLGQFPDLRGGGELGKKEGGWYPNAHYVQCHMLGSLSLIMSFKRSFVRLKSGFCYAGFTDFESLRQSLRKLLKIMLMKQYLIAYKMSLKMKEVCELYTWSRFDYKSKDNNLQLKNSKVVL